MDNTTPVNLTAVRVRFCETDAMQIVWHGEYIRYFEDGREAFGREHGISYNQIYDSGYTAPIVELHCNYKLPLTFGEEAVVETKFVPMQAAKMVFDYTVRNASGAVVAQGRTVQVFLDRNGMLQLNNPPFFQQWKDKYLP